MKATELKELNKTQRLFSREMLRFFWSATRIGVRKWSWLVRIGGFIAAQRRQAAMRRGYAHEQTMVPPMLILSATRQCNLNCTGCYSRHLHQSASPDMDAQTYCSIVAQACSLGFGTILIAGGEPFLQIDRIISGAIANPALLHVVFTNGTLLDQSIAKQIASIKNLVIVLSLEGAVSQTDTRRGFGVHQSVVHSAQLLNEHGLFFGTSFTCTSQNYEVVTADATITALYQLGCRLFFHIDYIPVASDTQSLVPSADQRAQLLTWQSRAIKRFGSLFISFPGNEEQFGGCLAAGRGFVHINPAGELEPCPFAPYSDVSLVKVSLREALHSRFLAEIRAHHSSLEDISGGCALWNNRTLVKQMHAAQVA